MEMLLVNTAPRAPSIILNLWSEALLCVLA